MPLSQHGHGPGACKVGTANRAGRNRARSFLHDHGEILQVDTYPAMIKAIAAVSAKLKERGAEVEAMRARLEALEELLRDRGQGAGSAMNGWITSFPRFPAIAW